MMDDPFARARVLFEQSRPELAERECRRVLAAHPDDPEGYVLLSFCQSSQGNKDSAESAKTAVTLSPNMANAHLALARAQMLHGDLSGAEDSTRRAIELEPWHSGLFGNLAAIKLAQYDWTAALAAADEGLALDPEDTVCLNNRASALTKLGRHEEAARTLESGLENNPEDSHSHANRGWSLLNERKPDEAIGHFREALRLDPESAWAREGLLEALRSRNWFYRRMLQFFLWMSRFPPRVQFGLLIGLWVLMQVLNGVAKRNERLAPFMDAVLFAYIAFVAASWFSTHIMNAILMTSRDGRLLLNRERKALAVACCTLVVAILTLAVVAIAVPESGIGPLAVYVFLIGVHASSAFRIPVGRFRWYGLAGSAAVLSMGLYVTIHQIEIEQQRIAVLRQIEVATQADTAAKPDILKSLPVQDAKRLDQKANRELTQLNVMVDRIKRDRDEISLPYNLYIYGSLATLFLHSFLVTKSQQFRFRFD